MTGTASICPLCGKENKCANEIEKATGVKQEPCWCTEVKFDSDLLARVPEELVRKACICRECAQASESQSASGG